MAGLANHCEENNSKQNPNNHKVHCNWHKILSDSL